MGALSNAKLANKEAAVLAIKLEVGNTAIDLLTAQVAKSLPEPYGDLVKDSTIAKILVANLAAMLIEQAGIRDDKVLAVSETMLIAGYQQFLQNFDIVGMFKGVVNKIDEDKLAVISS